MTVYVDDADIPYGRMRMSHMWADTLEELLAMADRIGVRRKWIQGHPVLSQRGARKVRWVHFDICRKKRDEAITRGAVMTDRYGPAEHTARLDAASDDPKTRRKGLKMLATIETIRALHAQEAS